MSAQPLQLPLPAPAPAPGRVLPFRGRPFDAQAYANAVMATDPEPLMPTIGPGPSGQRAGRFPLADWECEHGRLPTDSTPDCGCSWEWIR